MFASYQSTQWHPCCFCGGRHFQSLFSAPGFDGVNEHFELVKCKICHLVRTEPVLTDFQLSKYYASSYYGSGKKKFTGLVETLTYCFNCMRARKLLAQLSSCQESTPNTPRILDIGCGRASLLKSLHRMGCACYGIERADFPVDAYSQGIHFYKDNLEAISFDEDFFDAAIMWHVLEHMTDPVSTIQETARILRPGGVLALAVPNFGSLQAKLFRADWFHLDLPRHSHHFSLQTILRCLNKYGFNVLSISTYSIEQNMYGFIQSFFNKMIPFARPNMFYALLKKYDGFVPTLSLLAWLGLAFLISPFALLEYLISGILEKGATVIIYAENSKPNHE